MAQIETWLKCDLKKPVKVQYLHGNLFSQDNQANLIGVELYDNGTEVTASGTVTANIIREDGATVTATGSTSGNKASVVLPAAAYAIPGAIAIVIKITLSGVITTIAAVVGTVYRSSTDTSVDPGTIMPSIQTLISQIQTAVASIPPDYSSLWTSLAPAFSASTDYATGQHVTNNGKVYRFNTAHTAGAWVASEVTEVKLGNEISDLNAAVDTLNEGGLVLKDEVIGRNVRDWLDDHPEATTTVQDGSLTEAKFTTDLRHKLLTGYVYSESDFENDWDVYILGNNITITKPITAFNLDKAIDLNGKTITLDSNYQGNYIFNGVSGSGPTTFEYRQAIYGGTIDCNNVDCCVIWVDSSISNTTISNLVINNNIRGLFNYADSVNSKGAQVVLDNIVISHTKTHTDNYIGLDIQFGDSTIKNVWVQFFKYGVRNVYGTDNLFVNVHPWGYPKDGNYSDSSQMVIGFIIFGAYNRFYSCIADTFEPISTTEDASYTNGGIGFYVRAYQTILDGCYALTHSASNNNKHIYYYFDDTNPETGARNYLNNNVMNDCSVSLSQGQIVKGTGLYITSGKEYTLIYNNCILKNREFETKIANEALMPIKSVYETLISKGYFIYTDGTNRTMHWIKDDTNNPYMSLIVPYVDPKFRDEATMRTALYNSLLYRKVYPIQLFATDSGDLYAYQPETGKFAKITIGNWE